MTPRIRDKLDNLADRLQEAVTRVGGCATDAAWQFPLRQSGLHNVAVHCLDGGFGWPYAAPFDGILIAAAVRHPPAPLLAQLSAAGRLVAPCGDRNGQVLTVWERTSGGFSRQRFEGVRFVPLRGAFGWTQAEWPESAE